LLHFVTLQNVHRIKVAILRWAEVKKNWQRDCRFPDWRGHLCNRLVSCYNNVTGYTVCQKKSHLWSAITATCI